MAALAPQERGSGPPRWDEADEVLAETVCHDPRWYGLWHSCWTRALLAGYLAQQTGIVLRAELTHGLLHQHAIRLKQPSPVVHSRNPLYDSKGYG